MSVVQATVRLGFGCIVVAIRPVVVEMRRALRLTGLGRWPLER